MAHKIAEGFSPEMISVFKRAVQSRDLEKVRAALDNGVDPTTPLGAESPLMTLIFQPYDENPEAQALGLSREKYEDNTSAIIDLLLKKGLCLTEPSLYETSRFNYLVDQFILSDSQKDASTLVIHAIFEKLERGEKLYMPNITAQVAARVSMTNATTPRAATSIMSSSLRVMQSLHETVRARLLNPQTQTEKCLVQFHDRKLDYWYNEFQVPSIAALSTQLFQKPQPGPGITQGGPGAGIGAANDQQNQPKKAAGDEKFAENMEKLVQTLEKREVAAVLAEIDSDFIGLNKVKKSIRSTVVRQQFDMARQVAEQKVTPQSYSKVYLGNPGLGKTTIARKEAELLHAMGKVGPKYVEVTRENLIGGFIGHTEKNMEALFATADVIFIDEAYSLNDGRSDGGDFGKKIVDALVPALENNPNLVIFMAGYPEEMKNLINMNAGLSSRLTKYEYFDDMTNEELGQTLDLMLKKEGFTIEPKGREHIISQLDDARTKLGERKFGNARLVRNVVRALPDIMAERMFGDGAATTKQGLLPVPQGESLTRITVADVRALDFASVFGTNEKMSKADLPRNHPDWQASIGFGAQLRH